MRRRWLLILVGLGVFAAATAFDNGAQKLTASVFATRASLKAKAPISLRVEIGNSGEEDVRFVTLGNLEAHWFIKSRAKRWLRFDPGVVGDYPAPSHEDIVLLWPGMFVGFQDKRLRLPKPGVYEVRVAFFIDGWVESFGKGLYHGELWSKPIKLTVK